MKTPKNSPWGKVQNTENIRDIAYRVDTAGHGGIITLKNQFVTQVKMFELLLGKKLPTLLAYLDKITWNTSYLTFEEDCDWALFYLIYPFCQDEYSKKEDVIRTLKNWHYKIYEEFTNEVVPSSESYMKKQDEITEYAKGKWRNLSAIYYDKDTNFTKVLMGFDIDENRRTNKKVTILVPRDEYTSFAFILTDEEIKKYTKLEDF